jgi:hypothetical protein
VRMRSRKPWVFARRRLFGWYVRLLTLGTPSSSRRRARRRTGTARWVGCHVGVPGADVSRKRRHRVGRTGRVHPWDGGPGIAIPGRGPRIVTDRV